MMALIQYWHFTGDSTYNDQLSLGLQWQSGDNGDYMPSNYSSYLVRIEERKTSPMSRPVVDAVLSKQYCRAMTTKCSGAPLP